MSYILSSANLSISFLSPQTENRPCTLCAVQLVAQKYTFNSRELFYIVSPMVATKLPLENWGQAAADWLSTQAARGKVWCNTSPQQELLTHCFRWKKLSFWTKEITKWMAKLDTSVDFAYTKWESHCITVTAWHPLGLEFYRISSLYEVKFFSFPHGCFGCFVGHVVVFVCLVFVSFAFWIWCWLM